MLSLCRQFRSEIPRGAAVLTAEVLRKAVDIGEAGFHGDFRDAEWFPIVLAYLVQHPADHGVIHQQIV